MWSVASKQTIITCSSVGQVERSFQVFNQPFHSDNQDFFDQTFFVILSHLAESLQLGITVCCFSSCCCMFISISPYPGSNEQLHEVMRRSLAILCELPLYFFKNLDALHISTIPFAPCSNCKALPVYIVYICICIACSRRVLLGEIRAQELHQDFCLLILLCEMRKLQYLKSFK